jgi:ankyrin repeat protein
MDRDHIDVIQQMLADEEASCQGRRLADMLESDRNSPFQDVGIIKNSAPSQSTKSENTLTATGVMFFSKLFQKYLNDRKRTPAEFLKLLRQQRCDWDVMLRIRDTLSNPAMHMAVLAGRVDFIEMFLFLGLWGKLRQQVASPVVAPDAIPPPNRGYTARRSAESLSYKTNGQELFKRFDEYDEIWRALTPLSKVCAMGNLSLTRALIECDPEKSHESDVGDCLLYACGSGNHQLVAYILEKFTVPVKQMLTFPRDNNKERRIIDVVAMLGHTDIVSTIAKMMPNPADEALEQCALNGDTVGADILIKHGKRWSAVLITLAAKNSQETFVKHVLKKASGTKPEMLIDVNEGADENGQNALHHAVTNGALKIINILFTYEVDMTIVDRYGRNVIHLAVAAEQVDTTKLLLAKAKELGCLDKLINQHDFFVGKDIYYILRGKDKGRKAWHWVRLQRLVLNAFDVALTRGQLDVAKFGDILHSGYGSSPNATSVKCVQDEQECLLSKKHKDLTPLHLAIIKQNVPLVKLLLAEEADPNARDHFRAMPAHFAAMVGPVDILEMLAKHGDDPKARTVDNKTPFQVAQDNRHKDVMNNLKTSVA